MNDSFNTNTMDDIHEFMVWYGVYMAQNHAGPVHGQFVGQHPRSAGDAMRKVQLHCKVLKMPRIIVQRLSSRGFSELSWRFYARTIEQCLRLWGKPIWTNTNQR